MCDIITAGDNPADESIFVLLWYCEPYSVVIVLCHPVMEDGVNDSFPTCPIVALQVFHMG